MTRSPEPEPAEIVPRGARSAHAPRFIACGSEGAGKSTLVARLAAPSRPLAGSELDTGREDLAIASQAAVAVIVVDADKGMSHETRRHIRIVDLMGIRRAVLAVNKMDLADYREDAFARIAEEFRDFASALAFSETRAIPVAARDGDNVSTASPRMPWFSGPPLAAYLEAVPAEPDAAPKREGERSLADQFEARLLWMGEHPLIPGRPYVLRIRGKEVTATVTAIKYRVDVDTGAHLAARTLARGEIAVVNVSTTEPVAFEPYAASRDMGGFVLLDKAGAGPAGAGMIDFALRRASNIHWQALDLNKETRAASLRQRPRCIWFTGLSASGKSTIANLLEKRLHAQGLHTYLLDGDNVRHGLNRDLGFTEADRVENIRRIAEVARLMVDAGLIVLVSFISPFRSERRMARALFAEDEFLEVFVDAPLAECERRDPKGLYAKARRGELKNFTGIDSAYEPPEAAELRVPTGEMSPEACVQRIVERLEGRPR